MAGFLPPHTDDDERRGCNNQASQSAENLKGNLKPLGTLRRIEV